MSLYRLSELNDALTLRALRVDTLLVAHPSRKVAFRSLGFPSLINATDNNGKSWKIRFQNGNKSEKKWACQFWCKQFPMSMIDVTPPQLLLPLVREEALHPGEHLGTTRHLAPVRWLMESNLHLWIQFCRNWSKAWFGGPESLLLLSSIKGNSESWCLSFVRKSRSVFKLTQIKTCQRHLIKSGGLILSIRIQLLAGKVCSLCRGAWYVGERLRAGSGGKNWREEPTVPRPRCVSRSRSYAVKNAGHMNDKLIAFSRQNPTSYLN